MKFEFIVIAASTSLTLVLISIVYGHHAYRKATYYKRLPGRTTLAPEQFIATYYPNESERSDLILLIYKTAAQFFAVPEGVLRPQDTFGDVLTVPILFPQLYGLHSADGVAKGLMLHLLRKLERRFPHLTPTSVSELQIRNLGDVVEGFVGVIQRGQRA
ncbi:MAG: hypothetical protein Q8T11_17770 [Elusimicrobiota bacterium]|nr:hypothetical protein [Elusimicrobiota bacterium]